MSVNFSIDMKLIVSGSCDNTIKIWNVKYGSFLYTLNEHTKFVNKIWFKEQKNYKKINIIYNYIILIIKLTNIYIYY